MALGHSMLHEPNGRDSLRDLCGMQNQIACMWALSNGTILTPQQLLAVYASRHFSAFIMTGVHFLNCACFLPRTFCTFSVPSMLPACCN